MAIFFLWTASSRKLAVQFWCTTLVLTNSGHHSSGEKERVLVFPIVYAAGLQIVVELHTIGFDVYHQLKLVIDF